MHASGPTCIPAAHFLRLNDGKTRIFWGMQATIVVVFLTYTAVLFNLPMLWGNKALPLSREQWTITSPRSATSTTPDYNSTKERYPNVARPIAVDVWFALAFLPALDAITVVGSCNRPIIDHWHYFASVRMMTLASLASFIVLLSGNPYTAAYIHHYPGIVCILALTTYALIGFCLDWFHAPPPRKATNLRRWSLQEYATALSRSSGTWSAAITSTAVTCGLGTLLTALIPADWSTIIPVITTGFEAIFLRLHKFGRTSQYTLCAAPFFQGGVCVHWGLRQVMSSPLLILPPRIFFCLLLSSRLILDAHLYTLFCNCPEFHWARRNAVVSTRTLVRAIGALLVLEEMQVVAVVRWIKPVTVVMLYSTSIVGVAMPAAYNVAFRG
ncbi:hypothetical protein BJX66DRAFT_332228 [Aspergillus keveii]|uniref:Uncharacterized protein n=1 Tax=Aspergillus keveii TaxID=714993 RepID=A0ABR4GP80_9EURO